MIVMDHKPTIVIHGGMHKTGTSALQHLLASERDELLNHGVLFPDCESPHHNFVVNTRHPDWTPEPLLSQLNLAMTGDVYFI